MIGQLFGSDPTGATTAGAALAIAAVALIGYLFRFANIEADANNGTSVAHSRWATPADLVARPPKKPEGTPATRENRARLALHPSPLLGAFRDPLNRHAPPIDLRYMAADLQLLGDFGFGVITRTQEDTGFFHRLAGSTSI
jgi:hypothetical protein